MKLIHLSDLHIGKRVNEVSMIEDQEYILQQIVGIIKGENADAVLLSGDIPPNPSELLGSNRMEQLMEELKQILLSESFDGVGVYSPAHADDSYTWVATSYSRPNGKRRSVAFVEGMLGMYAAPVYKQLEPLDINPHGWGIDLVACFYARHWGLRCEVDDRMTITHPKGDVRKNALARSEARAYLMRYPEGIAIRCYWVACSLRNASIQPFILSRSYRKWLSIYLPIYRFFHR